MSEKEPFLHLRIKQDVPTYKAISAVMIDALRVTLQKASEEQGVEWLDTIGKELMFNAKSFVTDGISIETEAESFGVAIQVLEGVIGATRASIVGKQ
ncbi:hypothetical protein [Ochrobactrum sp. EDr1-4]|uniref:hypothetical protein n=1 Tax=Ochrobactrum sp. EDr1-4 TaxID=3368622 RepID=UPI003BA0DDCE